MSESWDRSHDHVVDGNNMLHALGLVRTNMRSEAFQAARAQFLTDLKRLWTGPGHLLICLDGHESPAIAVEHRGQVISRHLEVRFSLLQSADDLIVHMINESVRPSRMTVVSGDNDITREARRRGCRVAACVDWFAWLQHPQGVSRPASTTISAEKPTTIQGLEGMAEAMKKDIEVQQVGLKVPTMPSVGNRHRVSNPRPEQLDPLAAMRQGAEELLVQSEIPASGVREAPPAAASLRLPLLEPDPLESMKKGAQSLLNESSRAATAPRPDTPRPLRGAVDPGHAVGDIAGMGLPEDFIEECRQILENEGPKDPRRRPRGL